MQILNIPFIVFLAAATVCYWLIIPQKFRKIFLFICSLFFVATFNAAAAFYFLGITSLTYYAGIKIACGSRRKIILQLAVAWLICTLFLLKFYRVLAHTFPERFNYPTALNLSVYPGIQLPIGLTFITLRLVHYIADVYKGTISGVSFIDVALYALFFPTFLVGPIERFQKFHSQVSAAGKITSEQLNYGLYRILRGIVKILFSGLIVGYIMSVLYHPEAYRRVIVLLALYGYAVQIYLNFSGAIDMALGSSKLFGYTIMENFDQPLFKKNIAEFWRSWNISLYRWIRDFFFLPFFGYRASVIKMYIGIVISMIAFSMLHDVTPGFLVSGVYHGCGLVGWKLFQEIKKQHPYLNKLVSHPWLNPVSHFMTISFFSFGLIFFIPDIAQSVKIIQRVVWF